MTTHAPQYPSKHFAQDVSFIKFPRNLLAATHWVSLTTGESVSFSSSDKLLWLWMRDRHAFFKGRGGEWYDNQDAMATAAGVSTATVKRFLKALEKHGYLVKQKRGLSNSYTITSDILPVAVQPAQNDPHSSMGSSVLALMPAVQVSEECDDSGYDMYREYCDSCPQDGYWGRRELSEAPF